MINPGPYSTFTTRLQVRPDDIDMFNHVHSSKYVDYVLAARYEQMGRCYHLPMEEFTKNGQGWIVRSLQMDYKRPLKLGDDIEVEAGLQHIDTNGCRMIFEMRIAGGGKVACSGWFDYVLIDIRSGRAVKIPPDLLERCSI